MPCEEMKHCSHMLLHRHLQLFKHRIVFSIFTQVIHNPECPSHKKTKNLTVRMDFETRISKFGINCEANQFPFHRHVIFRQSGHQQRQWPPYSQFPSRSYPAEEYEPAFSCPAKRGRWLPLRRFPAAVYRQYSQQQD